MNRKLLVLGLLLTLPALAADRNRRYCGPAERAAAVDGDQVSDAAVAYANANPFGSFRRLNRESTDITREVAMKLAHMEPSEITPETVHIQVMRANRKLPRRDQFKESQLVDLSNLLYRWAIGPGGLVGKEAVPPVDPKLVESATAYFVAQHREAADSGSYTAKGIIGEVVAEIQARPKNGEYLSLADLETMVKRSNLAQPSPVSSVRYLADISRSLHAWGVKEGLIPLPARMTKAAAMDLALAHVDNDRPNGLPFLGEGVTFVVREVAGQLFDQSRNGPRLLGEPEAAQMIRAANQKLGSEALRSESILRDLTVRVHAWAEKSGFVVRPEGEKEGKAALAFLNEHRPSPFKFYGDSAVTIITEVAQKIRAQEFVTQEEVSQWTREANDRLGDRGLRTSGLNSLALSLHYWAASQQKVSGIGPERAKPVTTAGIELGLPVNDAIAYHLSLGERLMSDLANVAGQSGKYDGPLHIAIESSLPIFQSGTFVEQREKFYAHLTGTDFDGFPPQAKFLLFMAVRQNTFTGGTERTPEQRTYQIRESFFAKLERFVTDRAKRLQEKMEYVNNEEKLAAEDIGKTHDVQAYGEHGVDNLLRIPLLGESGEPSADIVATKKGNPSQYLIAEIKPSAERVPEDLEHALGQIASTYSYLKYHLNNPKPEARFELVMFSAPGKAFELHNEAYAVKGGVLFHKQTSRPVIIHGQNIFVRIVDR